MCCTNDLVRVQNIRKLVLINIELLPNKFKTYYHLVEYQFRCTREIEISVIQLLIETIVAPVGKCDPTFDFRTDIIFGGNDGTKVNKIRLREVHSYLNGAARIAQHHSALPYQLRRYTELRHCAKTTIPYEPIAGSLIVDKKMVCVELCFVGPFQDLAQCEDLVDGGFARSNQCFDKQLQSFTQYARKNLTCDRELVHIVGFFCFRTGQRTLRL